MRTLLLLLFFTSCAYHYETSFGGDAEVETERPETNRTR